MKAENEVVTLIVKRGTANWLEWKKVGDHERGKHRARAARRLIELWERIKRYRRWTRITALAPEVGSERRWVRRNIYTLENAGILTTRRAVTNRGGRVIEFKVIGLKSR